VDDGAERPHLMSDGRDWWGLGKSGDSLPL